METREYTVKWEIQVSSTSKKDAARKALQMMRDNNSTATVMKVSELNSAPDDYDEFDLSEDRAEKISFIKEVIKRFGKTSCAELELDRSPSMNSLAGGDVCELVEGFNDNDVDTVIYNGETEVDWNNYTYEKLSDDIIDEIVVIMEDYEADMEKTAKRIED
jgi:hypothetical protein